MKLQKADPRNSVGDGESGGSVHLPASAAPHVRLSFGGSWSLIMKGWLGCGTLNPEPQTSTPP